MALSTWERLALQQYPDLPLDEANSGFGKNDAVENL